MAFDYAASRDYSVDLARRDIGTPEVPARSNRTKYGKAYGWDGVFYCVIAVVCWLMIWGRSSAAAIRTASTGAMWTWGVSVGRTRRTPQKGDIVIVTSGGATRHTEIVESYRKGRLVCIGANTSNGFGSTDNGGGTYRNDRTGWLDKGLGSKDGWAIRGFVRPFHGVTVQDVQVIQRAAGIKVDGVIGPATVAAVRTIQSRRGLTADGFPGPATMAALGVTASPTTPATAGSTEEEELMAAKDDIIRELSAKIDALPRQVWGVGGGAAAPMIPRGEGDGTEYPLTGLSEVPRRTARLIAPLAGQVAGLTAAVEQLAKGQGIDLGAITAAAEKGARAGAAAVSADDVAAKLTVQAKQ